MEGSQKREKMDGEKRIERIVIQWKGKSVNSMESKGEKLGIVEGNEASSTRNLYCHYHND